MKKHLALSAMTLGALAAAFPAAYAAGNVIRARTHDHMTFDAHARDAVSLMGDMRGKTLDHAYRTHDGKTVDSTGAFLVGELERMDPTMHGPLAAVTWGRDINLRRDVAMGDEVTSFTLTSFGSQGGLGTGNGGANGASRNGKSWVGKATNQISGVSVDIGKRSFPLTPWALEVSYTIMELEAAARAGRPIDAQKVMALQLKYQMDVDEQVYVGDATLGHTGLVNNGLVTNVTNAAGTGTAGSTQWKDKTPRAILDDVNEIIQSVWKATGYAVMPTKLGLPPTQFGMLSTEIVSDAGTMSILKYLKENNVLKTSKGIELDIQPMKWLEGGGAGGTFGTTDGHDRMVIYVQEEQFVRFPLVPLARTPIQYQSIYHLFSYYGKLGVVEIVYPETIAYRDGI